ncbi:MAG: hypothetical protein ACXADA_07230 [Candidatus Hodarchaeales archaeon]|jgi:hypothetical protein
MMEEQESIKKIILLALLIMIVPGAGNDQMAKLLVAVAIILCAGTILLTAINQLNIFQNIIPDEIINLLTWISAIVAALITILMSVLNFLP